MAQSNNWQGDETDTDYQQMRSSHYYDGFNNVNVRSMTVDELKNVSFKNTTPITFNVFIHDLNNQMLNECDYLHGIRYLNEQFNQFHFYFKYIGHDHDSNPNNSIPNVLNVYLINNSGGAAYGPDNIRIGQICFDEDSPFIHTSTITHEFGHIFGINHTFLGTNSQSGDLTTPAYFPCYNSPRTWAYFPRFSSNSENVTRDNTDLKVNLTGAI